MSEMTQEEGNELYSQGQDPMVHRLSNMATYWNHLGALKIPMAGSRPQRLIE